MKRGRGKREGLWEGGKRGDDVSPLRFPPSHHPSRSLGSRFLRSVPSLRFPHPIETTVDESGTFMLRFEVVLGLRFFKPV